jgi:hypothetical protein
MYSQRWVPGLHDLLDPPEAAPAEEQLRTIHAALRQHDERTKAAEQRQAQGRGRPAQATVVPTGRGVRTYLAAAGISMTAPTAEAAEAARGPQMFSLSVTDRKLVKASLVALRAVLALELPDVVVPQVALCHTAAQATTLLVPRGLDNAVMEPVDLRSTRGAYLAAALAIELNLVFSVNQLPVVSAFVVTETVSERRAGGAPSEEPLRRGRAARGPDAARGAAAEAAMAEDLALPPPFMLWNAAGLLPPLYPMTWMERADFQRLRMRPEFVRDYAAPLCSTALLSDCPLGSQPSHRLRLFQATLHLLNDVVPAVARTLDKEPKALTGAALCERLHAFGVNLRFLGWLLPWMTSPDAIRAVNTEIVARAYKYVEDPEAGADWSTLTKVAFTRFYPPHVQIPLPRFHDGSHEFLTRLHPRYSVLVDTLELTDRVVNIPGVTTEVASLLGRVPATPDFGQGYEYEPFLPTSVDGEALEERIVELCHYTEKVMALPGRWVRFTRETIAAEPSHTLTASLGLTQDRLLARGEDTSPLSLRVLPLLRQLATLTARLFPYDLIAKSEQSAGLYLLHGQDVVQHALSGFDPLSSNSPTFGSTTATTLSVTSPLQPPGQQDFALTTPTRTGRHVALATGTDAESIWRLSPSLLRSSGGVLARAMASAEDVMGSRGGDDTGDGAALSDVPCAVPRDLLEHMAHRAWLDLAWVHKASGSTEAAQSCCQRAMLASTHPLHQLAAMNLLELLAVADGNTAQAAVLLSRQVAVASAVLPRNHAVSTSLYYRNTADPFKKGAPAKKDSFLKHAPNDDPFIACGVDSTTLAAMRRRYDAMPTYHYVEVYCEAQRSGPAPQSIPVGQFAVMDRVDRFLEEALNQHRVVAPVPAHLLAAPADNNFSFTSTMSGGSPVAGRGGDAGAARHLVLVCETSAKTIAEEIARRLWSRRARGSKGAPIVAVPLSVNVAVHSGDVPTYAVVGDGEHRRIDSTLALLKSAASMLLTPTMAGSPTKSPMHAGRSPVKDDMVFARVTSMASLVSNDSFADPSLRRVPRSIVVRKASLDCRPPPALRAAMTAESVTDTALFSLMTNPRCVLIVDGFCEGADTGKLRSLAQYGLDRWAGPVIVVLSAKGIRQMALDEVVPKLTERGGGASNTAHGFSPAVQLFATRLLSTSQLDRALKERSYIASPLEAADMMHYLRSAIGVRAPALMSLARDPGLMAAIVDALLSMRGASKSPATCASVLDAVLYRRYLRADDANVAAAVSYACALAGRLWDEGKYEAPNPAAQAFAHMLPLRYDPTSTVVAFAHPVWRSYFLALRSWLELILLAPASTSDGARESVLESYLGDARAAIQLIVTPACIEKAIADAKRRTGDNIKEMAMAMAVQSSVMLKAVNRFKRGLGAAERAGGSRSRLSGGEWVVGRNVPGTSDPYLLRLLADRADAHPQFRALLWEAVCPGLGSARLPYLSNLLDDLTPGLRSSVGRNAATILNEAKQSFAGKQLRGAHLSAALLHGACFSAADCQRVDFRFAVLGGSCLRQAEMLEADMKGADVGAQRQMGAKSAESGAMLSLLFVPWPAMEVVISGNEHGVIEAWDCETTDGLGSVRHCDAPISCLALSPSTTLLASSSGSAGNTSIVVWRLDVAVSDDDKASVRFTPTHRLVGHADRVSGVAFVDENILMSSGFDWTLRLWDCRMAPGQQSSSDMSEGFRSASPTTASPSALTPAKLAARTGKLVPLTSPLSAAGADGAAKPQRALPRRPPEGCAGAPRQTRVAGPRRPRASRCRVAVIAPCAALPLHDNAAPEFRDSACGEPRCGPRGVAQPRR